MTTSTCSGRVLGLADLSVSLTNGDEVIEDVSLELKPGEILGLVGESGSGKTTTAQAILGYIARGARIDSGVLRVNDELVPLSGSGEGVRGRLVSYVPQNTGSALNPSLRVIRSLEDMMLAHEVEAKLADRASDLFASVDLPTTVEFGRRFPHQMSGGQQQRVCIAISMAAGPPVIILDEPTTGLDVVTQSRILEELRRLRDERGIAMLYVTHDLAVVAQLADRLAVMYAGRIVEQGPVEKVLRSPRHPYTRGLIASIPDHVSPRVLEPIQGAAVGAGNRPAGCAFAPRCVQRQDVCESQVPELEMIGPEHDVRCFNWAETPAVNDRPEIQRASRVAGGDPRQLLNVSALRAVHSAGRTEVVAARDVSFDVLAGECVALVGESGSGKTTIARVIAGFHELAGGSVQLNSRPLPSATRRRSREQLRAVQLVAQNPMDALNPRHTVLESIERPGRVLLGLRGREAREEVLHLLDLVRLPANVADRYPSQLSGGERQRVVIARALATRPSLLVCDEVTSALDVSVQAAVLSLLADLKTDLDLGLLFITHDLGVVAAVADRVLVLESGTVCEQGPVAEVLAKPSHPYTQKLLQAAPSLTTSNDPGLRVSSP